MSQYPDFLIVGAAKAGTTSLVAYLNQHPDIYFSPIKEPHYFSKDIKPENFNQRYYSNVVVDLEAYFKDEPLKEIFEAYVRDENQYLKLFENADPNQVKGEASTTYLYSKEAAHHIYHTIPGAKIIAILRNPLERAYSHYLMALKFGFTSESLRQALKTDQEKEEKGWGISELFLELGLYYEQLKRYYDLFPSSQIQVIFHEDLYLKPDETLNQITDFLSVESFSFNTGESYNQGGVPRFRLINELLNKWGLRMKLGQLMPESVKAKLKSLYLKKPQKSLDDDPEAKAFLRDYFKADIEKTSQLLGVDLSSWLD